MASIAKASAPRRSPIGRPARPPRKAKGIRMPAASQVGAEPVFALLENRYDTPLVEAEYQLEAAAADPVVAQALQVPARSPIFLIERTSYTTGNRPIDYERLHYRGDLIRFVTRLVRHARASMQR